MFRQDKLKESFKKYPVVNYLKSFVNVCCRL
jgi:hypothetical protein